MRKFIPRIGAAWLEVEISSEGLGNQIKIVNIRGAQ